MRKKKLLLISLCSAMCLMSSACSWITLTDSSDTSSLESNEVKKETKKSKEKASAKPKKSAKPKSKKATIRTAIKNVVGSDNLETFNYVPDNNFSLIKFKGSENLTNNMTIKGMYMDIFDILKAIQSIIDTDVDFNVVYPLQDNYGNTEDVIVIKATFTNKTIKKIDFNNALWEDTPKIADEWWNHDAINLTD